MGKGPPQQIHTVAFHPFGLAWEAGAAAYRRGEPPTTEPYASDDHPRVDILMTAWRAGYWFAHQRAVTGK